MNGDPLIIAYFDGDDSVKILSNFAHTPFELDDVHYASVEAFWQSLKTEVPALRKQIYGLYGLDAKKAGRLVNEARGMFTYKDRLYKVGSEAHHHLLNRALRVKFSQCEDVKRSLLDTGQRPLRHMLKNRFGQWRPGDSPALPAIVFERMLTEIRTELQNQGSLVQFILPKGLNEF